MNFVPVARAARVPNVLVVNSSVPVSSLAQLVAHDRPFSVLTGNFEQRLSLAERITDQAVRERLSFTPPI